MRIRRFASFAIVALLGACSARDSIAPTAPRSALAPLADVTANAVPSVPMPTSGSRSTRPPG
jgi:hypothetical protein